MSRKIYYWKLRSVELQLGERTLLMGVLNVTPDSFSDGGRFNDPDRAYARALELEEQGADIIDIGAESTRPGSQRISADEEWRRLGPVLKRLRDNLHVPLSLDTYKSEIAERALEYGIEILNDPSGLTFDPELARVAANGNAGLVLNHMRGQPETWPKLPPMQDVAGTISRELEATVNRARQAGVERARIVIDPGLGFGKRKEQNAEILAHLPQLAALDYPILVGPSRKSFLAQSSESETLFATAGAVAAAVLEGAHIVRVHDVGAMRAVVQVAEEIARAAVSKTVQNEERPAMRPRRQSPNIEAERPRPPRPPISKPVEATPPPPLDQHAERPPYQDQKRDGFAPPRRRDFGPSPERFKPEPFKKDRFRPAAGKRPFERADESGKPPQREFRGDRPGGRPPRGGDGSRPPKFLGRSGGENRPPKRPFERADESGKPSQREFRGKLPGGSRPPKFLGRTGGGTRPPKRPFERKDDSGKPPQREFRGDRPGGSRPSKFQGRSDGGNRPPKRPFRKRP